MTWNNPLPETCTSFADRYTTAHIIGNVTGAVQRNAGPIAAPALAYVPIADGSSSAAPVIKPRPSVRNTRPPRDGEGCGAAGFSRSSDGSGCWRVSETRLGM